MLDITRRIYEAFASPKTSIIKGNSGLYPSSASIEIDGEKFGACHRQEYYKWFKYKPTESTDPETGLTSIMGDSLHEMVVRFLREHVIETDILVLTAEQAFFDQKNFISGRTDIFMKDMKTDKLHGCDIKTVGDYKASVTIEEPDLVHILQCAIYLDQYNKSAARNNSKPVEDWIILYLARSENYKLKKYPHGSLFKYLWQFHVTIESNNSVSVTNQYGATRNYPKVTLDKIYARYEKLLKAIKDKTMPDREYEYRYSEARLTGMLKNEKLNKGQSAEVEKWLEKGAKQGDLELDIGDFQCRYCNWRSLCYSNDPENGEKEVQVLYTIPKDLIIPKVIANNTDDFEII